MVYATLYSKYENADLNRFVNEHCKHLTEKEQTYFRCMNQVRLLFLWNAKNVQLSPICFEFKYDIKPACLGPDNEPKLNRIIFMKVVEHLASLYVIRCIMTLSGMQTYLLNLKG